MAPVPPQPFEEPAPEPQPVAEEPVYQQPVNEPVIEPKRDPKLNSLATTAMILGIAGLACSLSFWLSLVGIIVSAIGRGKIKAYLAAGGELTGKAKVGNILSKLGLIFGIILFVLLIVYLIVIIVAAVKGSGSAGSYHFYY